MNLFKNIEMESQIQKTNIITREKTRGGINWDIWVDIYVLLDFPGGSDGKTSASKPVSFVPLCSDTLETPLT